MDELRRLFMLGYLIDALQDKKRPHSDMNCLYVRFWSTRHKRRKRRMVTEAMSVAQALDSLHYNVHKFEDFDLADADELELYSI